jgi:hypothetical protein
MGDVVAARCRGRAGGPCLRIAPEGAGCEACLLVTLARALARMHPQARARAVAILDILATAPERPPPH